MFKMAFKVVEITSNCVITHYLNGNAKDVTRDIENFKKNSKGYELFGKEGMVVWT